jgi:lipoate synthase
MVGLELACIARLEWGISSLRARSFGLQVPRLQSSVRDRRANWDQSLTMLKAAKAAGMAVTKTSIMLGCGEEGGEVLDAMQELRDSGTTST